MKIINPSYSGGLFHSYMFVILGMSDIFCRFYSILMEILLAKNVDPDQTPHYMASDLGHHSLPMTLVRVFS